MELKMQLCLLNEKLENVSQIGTAWVVLQICHILSECYELLHAASILHAV